VKNIVPKTKNAKHSARHAAARSAPERARGHLGPVAARSARRALARREARHDDAVRKLVDASFALIRETGSLEPSVASIVERAGLSNQAFYRHFHSKDELLLGVLDEGFHVLASYLAHRVAQAVGAEGKIRAWIGGVLEQALDGEAAASTRPFAVSRARLSELFPEEVEVSERALIGPLRDALAEAVASGALPGADPDRDAGAIYTLAIGWVQRMLCQRAPAQRAEADHLVEFALSALRRPAQAPRSGARSEPQASEVEKVASQF
jgi:AcrR family transcriptional regulator